MVTIRSVNEIILSLIDYYKLAQPDLDTKPGTVARDLFVDGPSSQLALLYDQLSSVSSQQSMRLVIGSDLDRLAKNFGVIRKQSTPATGVALLTFSSISAPIPISVGSLVIASNGFSYSITAGISVTPSTANFYRSVANKFRDQLDAAGISDQYAIEVTVIATTAGSSGNIGTLSLSRTNVSGVSNVTNINPFSGGTDQEDDSNFRNRVLAAFSGSSVGTALGYLNTALGTTGVSDAAVVEPGDALMTRDGTVVSVAGDGTRTIVSEGSGGKVDVIILGSNLVQNTDTFIFADKSNNNDPTSVKNDVVMGQIAADVNKTINRKRIDDIKNGQLPAQPVNDILSVTGSISGSNFIAKTTDIYGRIFGNFELLKDTGVYGGSPFGFDTFHWISNKISLFSEDRVKSQFNGQDITTFTDVLEVPQIQQSLSITNENSIVTSDKSLLQLLHTPATNVTRVFNVNTGERYIVTDQNPDETGVYNTTGRIQISGNTLPSTSDLLQVDYSWIVNFDQHSDYDGLVQTNNPRDVTDSIDWGYSSVIRNEKVKFTLTPGDNFFTGTTSHPIDTIVSTNVFTEVDGTVALVTSGTYVNRLSVVIIHLADSVDTIDQIILKNSNAEVYNTAQANGIFAVTTEVVGIQILYVLTVILPTDTVAKAGDSVTLLLNSTNVFHSNETAGSSSGTQVTIPSSLIDTTATNIALLVTYIASVSDLFASSVTSLPASKIGNGFNLSNNNGFPNFSPANISIRENQVVQQNLSSQFYIEVNSPSADFTISEDQVLSIVRLSDGYELWSSNHLGTIAVGTSGNYQFILPGLNTPATGDRVLAVYYSTDTRRFQPFSFSNSVIKTRVHSLALVPPLNSKFTVPLNSFVNATGLTFEVLDPNTDIVLFTGTDGVLTANVNGTANFTSAAVDFSTQADLTHKKLKIITPVVGNTHLNNDGVYDIKIYTTVGNSMVIQLGMSNLSIDNISVIRVVDGKEIWNYSGTVDVANNRITFPVTSAASQGDVVFVMYYKFGNLRKSPTRIVGVTLDQIVNTGIVTVSGSTLSKAEAVIFTSTNTGLKLNLGEALRKTLSLSSVASIPSNIRIAKIVRAEKVVTASSTDDTVLDIVTTYDTIGTTIQNNLLFSSDMFADPTLQALDFVLPNTINNTINTTPVNLPTIGDKIRVTFYYITDNDSENLSYTRNGTLYTNKKFAIINKFFTASGFKASQSTRFTASSFTQPGLGSRYKIFYDYTAPKQNERIVVSYNFNKLISDVTFSIENARPINADVLARQASQVKLDLTINVVIDSTFSSSSTNVIQNLRNQLITAMTTSTLAQIVDSPTLINVAQAVDGIARARILYFNKTGQSGTVLKVQAQGDEYFAPNNIVINTETR